MQELKPCPFCGGEAHVFVQLTCESDELVAHHSVSCTKGCGVVAFFEDTEVEAIDAWNTRAERTCRMEWDEDSDGEELYPVGHVSCSACGAWLYSVNTMRFCPKCGAKVVE